ncbi:PREDICTED: gibberellin 3-beta-dioxygenase 4 [Nelumbo nucifera]|uniref:Fe2OG dioxygenase domain-containing protein n=2 Tax=Nelumbo nucifera TaxID=4432 RepID=A0A822XN34_NELNU|nr:PREDICTED: gibberellin 3-beta-dioxygenase 4 [Nelumbo nucifera]DAD18928.1 TPA_asm: hypothetical protein HUJ06_020391 [Nelumbo nucifera]
MTMSESQTFRQLPVLDISQPLDPSSLSFLSQACRQWGFFYITNHGIPKALYDRLYLLSTNLFKLPSDSKLKLGPPSCIRTYTPHFIASPYYEGLRVSGPDFFASAKNSSDVLFDAPNPEFCETLQEYGRKMSELAKRISEIVLETLGDGFYKKYCDSEFGSCHGYLRIINYTPPETVEKEEVEGLGMHTDMSCITVVYQDQIGGLQMRSNGGEWVDVSPCEGNLVVNIGDLLEAWSNGRLKSSQHRVVLRRFVNRLSLAFFWCFEDEKVVLAPDEVVGQGNTRMYRPFVCLDYLKFRQGSETNKFHRVGLTVKDFARSDINCDK